jgi:hypothetical protein
LRPFTAGSPKIFAELARGLHKCVRSGNIAESFVKQHVVKVHGFAVALARPRRMAITQEFLYEIDNRNHQAIQAR